MGRRQSVVVLGAAGMLGSMIRQYLRQTDAWEVWVSVRAAEREQVGRQDRLMELDALASDAVLESTLAQVRPQWIINCIGVIKPYCQDEDPVGVRNAIIVNALFPHRLGDIARALDARVIQIATDCVFSGRDGPYDEKAPHDPLDVYGKTKSLGEVKARNVLNMRCSIIGVESRRPAVSLLGWFLSQPDGGLVPGFEHHRWNGVTTLQFAQLCQAIMAEGEIFFDALVATSSVHHFIPNETVSKYELLALCAKVFKKTVTIQPVGGGERLVDRSLSTRLSMLSPLARKRGLLAALNELVAYVGVRQ